MLPVTARRFTLAIGSLVVVTLAGGGAEEPLTGPQTEKRFPVLKLPAGFRATLFACDPFIEYPSVIAAGPNANSLFVAIDYMTGLGEEIVRRDEIRLIEDTDGDGYADKSTVFADGFNSIQGLAYHDGSVYVMHAPFLTVLRDTRGTGVADDRRDLLTGLGLPPEKNRTRLHCANGVVVGHDGWLYLAMGDNGIDVLRLEGDRLVLNGGGILRCRPDGRDLHVFATGLRNIYDVALDAELNVFVRDNENDGGDYKIRVCHSFFGADHGYPYLYYERPDEALPPIANLGLGSSAGGVCYLERGFPAEFRGDLFFCEWGRSVVRYRPRRVGSGFGPVKEFEFAAAAENDPYGFKPTDLVVQRDGALFVSDWADGQRPKRGRGRIYRITATNPPEATEKHTSALDSESYAERLDAQLALQKQGAEGGRVVRRLLSEGTLGPRGRLHAVWLLSRGGTIEELLKLAQSDSDRSVRAQAIRAIADRADPVLVEHRLAAGQGDESIASRLAALPVGTDARLVREVVIALGRLKWAGTPDWVAKNITKPDAALAHAAMQAMRAAGNWPAVLASLDRPTDDAVRGIALRAIAGRHESEVVDGLIARLKTETNANRRMAYADALTRVHRKPGAWVYWGYRPGPRTANTVDWDRTDAIAAALDQPLADPDLDVRLAVLRMMRREKVPARATTLAGWLREERGEDAVALILEALRDTPAGETGAALESVVRETGYGTVNRLRALALRANGNARILLELAGGLEPGPVLAEVLRRMGRYPPPGEPATLAAKMLPAYTMSPIPEVRAAAVEALGELHATEGQEPALTLLEDREPVVRQAAAVAAGKLVLRQAAEPLLKLAGDADAGVRGASLEALRQLREPRAVPLALAALDDRMTQLAAIDCLADLGGPGHVAAVAALARRAPPTDVLFRAVRLLAAWAGREGISAVQRGELDRAVAEVHGATGAIVRWKVCGPIGHQDAAGIVAGYARASTAGAMPPDWRPVLANAPDLRARLVPSKGATAETAWFAHADIAVSETTAVEFTLIGANTADVWLNGKSLHRSNATGNRNSLVRFSGELTPGTNRVLVRIGSAVATADFGLTFRRKSATAKHESLTQVALGQSGNVDRGRALFLNAEKSLCLKCHRVGDHGERVGPELTGIGARFGRVYLIESILEPSRTVVPGFATLRVELKDGRVFTGVNVGETDSLLTLVDQEIKKHDLKKTEILERQPSPLSGMPDGLENRLTEREFVDLIAYLVSLKDRNASQP